MSRWIAGVAVLAWIAAASPVPAQFPGELEGRVVDAGSGAAVEGARVDVPTAGRTTVTDARGAFRLRGLEPGDHDLSVARIGYAAAGERVRVRNGGVTRVEIGLVPSPVALDAATARGTAAPASARAWGRRDIERIGARTAADLVARAPGVVVRADVPGGPQTISVRGAAPDAVLVLVDGVPLNDPVTGVADLSTVPASAIERITLLPGAWTARYGPRAAAGVVLIETRSGASGARISASAGSLGERAIGFEVGRAAWVAGASARGLDGGFGYPRLGPADTTRVERSNADLREIGGFVGTGADVFGGALRARIGLDVSERGLPGLGHAPSPEARQERTRGRAALGWTAEWARWTVEAGLSGAVQGLRHSDIAPPFGFAYDDTARVGDARARVAVEQAPAPAWLERVAVRVEGVTQRFEIGALSPDAPRGRIDLAVAASAAGAIPGARWLDAALDLRLDRDGVAGAVYGSHAVSVSSPVGPVQARLSHRSAFSPPALGDQFFREGVAVRANPELRPERVPSEWELGLSAEAARAGWLVSAGVDAYRGDVRDLIVWLPDFRFVWSPRNTDVHRRGLDARVEASHPAGLRVSAGYGLAAITYDRERGERSQVAYRPRHTARLGGEFERHRWRLAADARYLGARYPVPAPRNELPGFWTVDVRVGHQRPVASWLLDTTLTVERALDERGSLIFGFPDPGRRLRVEVGARPIGSRHHSNP